MRPTSGSVQRIIRPGRMASRRVPSPITTPSVRASRTSPRPVQAPEPNGLAKNSAQSSAESTTISESIPILTGEKGFLNTCEMAPTVISAESIQALAATSMLTPRAVTAPASTDRASRRAKWEGCSQARAHSQPSIR